MAELEGLLDQAGSRASALEKVKVRLQGELEDMTIELERVRRGDSIEGWK